MTFYIPLAAKFRMANILGDERSASECSLICDDSSLILPTKLTIFIASFPDHPPNEEEVIHHSGVSQDRAWFTCSLKRIVTPQRLRLNTVSPHRSSLYLAILDIAHAIPYTPATGGMCTWRAAGD